MTWVWLESKSCEVKSRLLFKKFVAGWHRSLGSEGRSGRYGGKEREEHVNRCDRRGSRSVDASLSFSHRHSWIKWMGRGTGWWDIWWGKKWWIWGGVESSAQSRHSVSSNCLSRMRAGDLIGLTGSPGIWEPWRERGHVTSTHYQLSQILLAQLAAPGSFPSFPRFQGRLVLEWGRHPRGRVTDSQADLAY